MITEIFIMVSRILYFGYNFYLEYNKIEFIG